MKLHHKAGLLAVALFLAVFGATGPAAAGRGPVPVPSHVGYTTPGGSQARSAATTCSPKCYYYGVGSQDVSTLSPAVTGLTVNLDVYKPTVNTAKGDFHSLVEIAAQDNSGNTVELGWNVDPSVNGDSNVHLFTFYWINNVPQSYNSGITNCGGAVTSPPVSAGATLLTTTTPLTLKNFNFQYSSNMWWLGYNGSWIGCLPNTLWTAAGTSFASATYYQVFGEVVSSHDYGLGTKPCAPMGSGVSPAVTTTGAARFGNATWIGNTTVPNLFVRAASNTTVDPDYSAIPLSATNHRSGYFGGSSTATSPTC